jgi:hypothetical protein
LQFLSRQGSGGETGAELFEQTIQKKCEGFEQDKRMFQFDGFFEGEYWIDGNQGT